jgi:Mn2+/Fe2+ NRAMP family transporter
MGVAEEDVDSRPAGAGMVRTLGLGLITGAADDDPSAIGTYASAGAAIGPSFLWTAPVTFPMMVTVVYLSSKLGQVSGRGLFECIRGEYGRRVLWLILAGVLFGNTIEAGADLGGMAAALQTLVPIPVAAIVVPIAVAIVMLQLFGSYQLMRSVFRWLALALLAYIPAALLADPHFGEIVRGTLTPSIHFDRKFLALLVAVIGTTLSAYLYTWQSNQEVEEEISIGRTTVRERRGATEAELRRSRVDITVGMAFSNIVMFFIILATASTLHRNGTTNVSSAAQAAEALRPVAGDIASLLFAVGVIGVGFLAVPIMTTGAAYDVSQTFGWRNGLQARPAEAKGFYGLICLFTLLGMTMNLFGINPIKALVFAGIVQGFSTPVLLFMIMRLTNNPRVIGEQRNSRLLNICGWITTAAVSTAAVALVISIL